MTTRLFSQLKKRFRYLDVGELVDITKRTLTNLE
jgi:hypothetical protein